jgi:membrane protein YqaA with SNARE-associated domain
MKEAIRKFMLNMAARFGFTVSDKDGNPVEINATFWRMGQWVVFANLLYLVALLPAWWPPQVQTGLLAAANCTLGSWVGYWIDATAFKRIDNWENKHENITAARSLVKGIIIGACILACNIKLG